MTSGPSGSHTCEVWRFEARLAALGIRHPPAFCAGALDADERRFISKAAAELARAARTHHLSDPHRVDLRNALNDARNCIIRHEPRAWPPVHDDVDFTVLVGWGARRWTDHLRKRQGRLPARALRRAERIVSLVDAAIAEAAAGGRLACRRSDVTSAVGRLGATLLRLRKTSATRRPRSRAHRRRPAVQVPIRPAARVLYLVQ